MFQAAPMNCPQGPCTFTRREQVLLTAALVADPAHRPVIEGAARQGEATRWSRAGNHRHAAGPRLWAFGPSPAAAAQDIHLL